MDRQSYSVDLKSGRLDVYLSEETGKTRSYIKQLNDGGHILVNGERVKCGRPLAPGDRIEIEFPEESVPIEPEDIPLDILYEDADIAVINKQQGLTVHPAGGVNTGTLVNALLYRIRDLSAINGVIRPGIVHRLDKNTSGVMVVAKNDAAHLNLSNQIASRTIKKTYRAVLEGNLTPESGTVETLIARSARDRKKMAVTTRDGRPAVTGYTVLERYNANCYVEFDLKTGRTHQIRVHAKYLGHPVVGDPAYGFSKQRFSLAGQLLHSYELTLTHPATGRSMTFRAPLPDYFRRVLTILRRESGLPDGEIV